MRFRVAVLPLEHVLWGITLPRCYTIRVLCCVNNNTIWNLGVLSTERSYSAETGSIWIGTAL
ncbi:hypothetical protein [Anaplasma phagocytophilum]|uniref:hypothetical protein n=1 Tax=Anaplasma phagocytophilum TaxID=948 RepID=UPI000A90A23A|nr:hypothetical protein [Anaplasma phagocytophilum]